MRAIQRAEPCEVVITNYKKNSADDDFFCHPIRIRLNLKPVHDSMGEYRCRTPP